VAPYVCAVCLSCCSAPQAAPPSLQYVARLVKQLIAAAEEQQQELSDPLLELKTALILPSSSTASALQVGWHPPRPLHLQLLTNSSTAQHSSAVQHMLTSSGQSPSRSHCAGTCLACDVFMLLFSALPGAPSCDYPSSQKTLNHYVPVPAVHNLLQVAA
jgi:hypothetical protein